uniref:Uncharacterized protein n=1 Tax=Cucumis melo TaxID=3656 RepID=A0A9I9CV61_CUCME
MPGLVSGDTGCIDDSEDSFTELSNSSHQRFNILCSGDKEGSICFSIFGVFPIGKIIDTRTLYSQLELDEVRMELVDFLVGHVIMVIAKFFWAHTHFVHL